ncbi:MAG: 50S ribosomal protein L4 [Candidatus Magasanikbacteria bacterium GW2011_GWC2_34_16]|uniref:Large ribosomal subunit protein uL4 n=2 Tax=Candidatus Magasanikiibacteriota TaxID=1752731 RepID=A0A0G0H7Q1_9BACT|nr:MAG: 50S ribosomal protein L4 [Candidatus Magasanikbacteria bacterium GW2011_GWC2_34_16]KKQ39283.1 MAG: 50S ribosomal protein L4 [Candidatus Magasanikbacteria bacterium GW2011_GWA2_37_8]
MKTKVYNLTGQEVGEIELSDKVFGVKVKADLVHQVFVQQTNNQRQPWADTKNRGEVSGGGKKPWAQKGTGRARHGSIRSPIWKGGGVAFGPLSVRNYTTKINVKTRRLVTKMCLADKAINSLLVVVEDFKFTEPKTKLFAKFLTTLPVKTKSWLVLTPGKDEAVLRQTKNLPKVNTVRVEDVNVMNLVNNKILITSKEGIKQIEEMFGK